MHTSYSILDWSLQLVSSSPGGLHQSLGTRTWCSVLFWLGHSFLLHCPSPQTVSLLLSLPPESQRAPSLVGRRNKASVIW